MDRVIIVKYGGKIIAIAGCDGDENATRIKRECEAELSHIPDQLLSVEVERIEKLRKGKELAKLALELADL